MIRLNCFFQAADAAKYKDALRAAVALTEKSRHHAGLQHEIGKSVAMPGGISHTRVAVLCMEIDHLSGKEAIELVRAHK